jgi:hypothetical protein
VTRTFRDLKSHFANWRHWELNPVVVKELRQAVRSWAVTGTLLLFLIVLFCSAVVFFVTQSFDVSTNQRLGAEIFSTFAVILTGASVLFIPLYIGVRMAVERQESNLDLLYISTLTPQRIIRGKFFCGAYVTVLFFSACMPFMTFTNLLRGVDLPSVFFVLLCLFLAVCCAVQVAIFLACLPISKVLKILVALIAFIMSFWLVGGLVAWSFEMMGMGVGSMMMSNRDFWPVFFTVCGVIFAGTLLLYFLSVALISPLSANRAVPIRVYITTIWALGAVLCYIWSKREHDARLMLPWAIVSFTLFALSLVVVVSNQDALSLRVQRKIPRRAPNRALAFLFYNGAAGGLVWLALLTATTYFVTRVALTAKIFTSTLPAEDLRAFLFSSVAAMLYAFDYALTGLLLHRQFFRKRSPRLAGIMTVLLPGAWALAPVIFLFAVNNLSTRMLERTQLGNIFNLFTVDLDPQRLAHVEFAACWLVLMLALNAKWFVRQISNFRPAQRTAPRPTAVEAPPVISEAVK